VLLEQHLKYFDSVLQELQRSLTYLLPLLDLQIDNKKMIYLLKSDKKKDVLLQNRQQSKTTGITVSNVGFLRQRFGSDKSFSKFVFVVKTLYK
jgi:hypothetical protein